MTHFKVGSFNLYNLVLPNYTYYGNRIYSNDDYFKKLGWIRGQIKNMGVQLVGFQEVFHKQALIEALSGTQFSPENIHVLGDTGAAPVVGLASVYPVVGQPETISKIPDSIINALGNMNSEFSLFSRPVLKIKVALNQQINVTVFVCHLKSKRPIFADGEDKKDFTVQAVGETRALLKRAVEASGLRALILDEIEENNNPAIVIGDLNDTTRSVTSNIIAGPQPWKTYPLNVKKKYWDRALYSSFDIISQKSYKKAWSSYIHNGHYEALDHIYVSDEFYFRNPRRVGTLDFVHVHDDHLKDKTLSKDILPVWKSDHGQVVVTITLK